MRPVLLPLVLRASQRVPSTATNAVSVARVYTVSQRNAVLVRNYSTGQNMQSDQPAARQASDHTAGACDMIGPPDPVSGIRPVRYHIPENESEEDRLWRERREAVDRKHQEFWYNNNSRFEEAKSAFMKQLSGDTGGAPTEKDMDIFYRRFLLERAEEHRAYHRWWIRENFSMLLPALRSYWRHRRRSLTKS